MLEILLYALIPSVFIVIGGVVGLFKKPSSGFDAAVLHFTAGVVFSVVAVELLPEITKDGSPIMVAIGFSLGVITMLLVKHYSEKLTAASSGTALKNALPIGLILALGIDLLIDGMLLGVGFAVGNKEGILLTAALSFEVFSLGLSVSLACKESEVQSKQNLIILVALGLAFFIGTLLGVTLLSSLSQELIELVLAFGLAALLFLVTEELLIEAHEEEETPFQTVCFFVGFLLFLIIGMIA